MYIFAETWRVNLFADTIKNPITDLLLFCNTCRIMDKNCGLKSDIRNFYKYEYLEKYLIECIHKGWPVIVSVDLIDITWSEYYHKVHSPHFIIIYDYLDNHIFRVCDATKQIDSIELDLKSVFDDKTCTVTISEAAEYQELSLEDIINASKQIIRNDVETNFGYEALFQIADYYFKENPVLFGLPKEEVEAEPFINKLVYFGRQRLAFSEFLKYVSVGNGDMGYQSLIADLGNLGAKWLAFRNKLMKIRLKGTFDEKKEELRIQWIDLVRKDKAIYERFIIDDKEEQGNQKKSIQLELLTPLTIDISGQFNANAFNSSKWKNPKGFDLNGYFYELDQNEMYYEPAHCNVKFHIEKPLDHISCSKQIISVMRKEVKAIMVIGSCENGDYSEDLVVTYDNRKESVSLLYPDWWECNRFNEKVVTKLNCCKMTGNQLENMGEVYIFSQVLIMSNDEDGILRTIELPDCSNIHIFELIVYS